MRSHIAPVKVAFSKVIVVTVATVRLPITAVLVTARSMLDASTAPQRNSSDLHALLRTSESSPHESKPNTTSWQPSSCQPAASAAVQASAT